MRTITLIILLILPLFLADAENGCADVIAATAEQNAADGTWRFSVTVSSPDTGWEKYADAWEVRHSSLGGTTVLGTRVLAHPHVTEQPFTRSLLGVVIPETVDTVVIAARDSVEGYCGEEFTLQLPRHNGNETIGSSTTAAPPSTETPSPLGAPSAAPSSSPSAAPMKPAAANSENAPNTSGNPGTFPCIKTWLTFISTAVTILINI